MAKEGELWHLVEAKREDGSPTIFRIRELEPRLHQTRIFVAELPYPVSELSGLPDAPEYRRFGTFEEQWLDPACNALGWTPVAVKIEDGSFFVYLYGSGDPLHLIERLSPFDGALGFFDEHDATWDEYAALRELLEEAKAIRPRDGDRQDERDGEGGSEPDGDHDDAPIAQIESALRAVSEDAHTKTTTPIRKPRATTARPSARRGEKRPKAANKPRKAKAAPKAPGKTRKAKPSKPARKTQKPRAKGKRR